MKAINQLTEVLLKFDGVVGLSVDKPVKQFVIKSIAGKSYLLDLAEQGNNEVLFS